LCQEMKSIGGIVMKIIHATQQATIQNGEGHHPIEPFQLPQTPEELQKMLQSEADKRVTQAIKTARVKWQRDMEEKVEALLKRAEKMAEKRISEVEKEWLLKHEEELNEWKRALAERELELKAVYLLTEKRLPLEFTPFVISEDEAKIQDRVQRLESLWNHTIQEAIAEYQYGNSPHVVPFRKKT